MLLALVLLSACPAVANPPPPCVQRGLVGWPDHAGRLAIRLDRRWPADVRVLRVRFLEPTGFRLAGKILRSMNTWYARAGRLGPVFVGVNGGPAEVRITRAFGGWGAYVGTDALAVDQDQPTMFLEGLDEDSPEDSFRGGIWHETGHLLGFIHENLVEAIRRRIDPARAYAWYAANYGWDAETTRFNVLDPPPGLVVAFGPHEDSIMCYWLPAEIMRDHKAVPGGTDITTADVSVYVHLYVRRALSEGARY